MSDSHKYIGDPDVVDVPEALYSKEYARRRAELINMDRAFGDMPPWGDPHRGLAIAAEAPRRFGSATPDERGEDEAAQIDTTSLNVIDGDGNVFSMTESDGHMISPMIPGWGFGLGDRMAQLNLDPSVANVMAPHKRPRNTNSPVLIMKEGEPFMGLSTPGGDQQVQSILQVVLNVILWKMSPEQALDQPRFGSYNFPETGSEVNRYPARLNLEDRIPQRKPRTRWGNWGTMSGRGDSGTGTPARSR